MTLQKYLTKRNKKELWKVLRSLEMKLVKINQSKVALKWWSIQFEPTKNANILGILLWFSWKTSEKVASCTYITNSTITQQSSIYYMNIDKSCHNFELCNATLETIQKILACLDSSKAAGLEGISSKFWKIVQKL